MAVLGYKVSDKSSRYLEPTGGTGIVDVVNDFQWTLQGKDARQNVPRVIIKEYQQTAGQLIASIVYYSRVIGSFVAGETGVFFGPKDPGEVYKYKYFAEETGFTYVFPYFNPKHTSRTTDFGYEDGQSPFEGIKKLGQRIPIGGEHGGFRSLIGVIGGEIPALADAAVGIFNSIIPGKLSLENPQSWVSSSEGSYTLTFDLFNTGTVDDIINNRNLAHILRYQNSPSRRNFAIVDPTVIYDVYIPDITYLPAAYMSDLQITNLGNTRQMNLTDNVPKIIPEAYRFSITFTSLFMPTRNILDGMDKGKNVTAIASSETLVEIGSELQKGNFSRANELIRNAKQLPVDTQTLLNMSGEMEALMNPPAGPPAPAQ